MDLTHRRPHLIVTMCKRSPVCDWFIPLLVSSVAVVATGCWEEVRYNPTSQPVAQSTQAVAQGEETPPEVASSEQSAREEPSGEEPTSPLPTTTDLFTEESASESEVPAPAHSLAAPAEDRSVEPSTGDDPLWDASETVKVPSGAGETAFPTENGGPQEFDPPVVAEAPTLADSVTELAAWRLASKWSLAVGIFGKGYGADRYDSVWNQAEHEADTLGVSLPPLPQNVAEDELVTAAAAMLLEGAGPELAAELGRRHSPRHAALSDLAIKTHGLLLIYTPDGREVKSLIATIRRSAEDSALPAAYWSPLVELLDARAEFPEIKRAVFQLHSQAEEHLGQAAAQ